MTDLNWLTSTPIAHRGFHDSELGVVENSPSAIMAAVERGYQIEVDLQETADHRALVFHDFKLERLTTSTGRVVAHDLRTLQSMKLRGSTDHMWSLDELLEQVSGRVGLCIEVKSGFSRVSTEFVANICKSLHEYNGPAVIKSFDPEILAMSRRLRPSIPRGVVAEDTRDLKHWGKLTMMERFILRHMLHFPRTRPSFVSYRVDDLPAIAPYLARRMFRLPVVTWTVRTTMQREIAKKWADQMVFEGFAP